MHLSTSLTVNEWIGETEKKRKAESILGGLRTCVMPLLNFNGSTLKTNVMPAKHDSCLLKYRPII